MFKYGTKSSSIPVRVLDKKAGLSKSNVFNAADVQAGCLHYCKRSMISSVVIMVDVFLNRSFGIASDGLFFR